MYLMAVSYVYLCAGTLNEDYTTWKKEHTLTMHDLIVASLDWSSVNNKIVSCSHDRNAFVWTFTKGQGGVGQT